MNKKKISTAGLTAALALASSSSSAGPKRIPVSAPIPTSTVGVSNLVLHLDGEDDIGLAGADVRVLLLERLREKGFNAVGAENLVFGKDEGHKAAYRLGGTIRELQCNKTLASVRCRIGVEWMVLDVARDAIVYKAMVRALGPEVIRDDVKKLPPRLLGAAIEGLIAKDGFRQALAATSAPAQPDARYKDATFAACAAQNKKMPKAAEHVLNATAIVRTQSGFGSGVFVSADGLMLTAAHVVSEPGLKIKLRDGVEADAVVLRRNEELDVALLKVGKSMNGQACLEIAAAIPATGDEVYAAGAPADEKLAFSITRGILSGIRELDGKRKLQTDAAVSPGNSGGPLVNGDGALAAIVTSKLVGKTIEGIAFSAFVGDALKALSIAPGPATSPDLQTPQKLPEPAVKQVMVIEPDDPIPSFTFEQDRLDAEESKKQSIEQWRREERERRTPTGLKNLFRVSAAVAVLGVVTLIASQGAQDDRSATTFLYSGGALTLGGGIGMTVYAARRPPLPPWPGDPTPAAPAPAAPAPPGPAQVTIRIGPGGLGLAGSF